jgi:competence protein ComFC
MTSPALGTLDGLFDLLFPPKCIVCGEINPHYLCASCIPEIAPVPRPYCPQCGHPIRGLNCRNCWNRVRSFTAARAAGDYSEVLRQSIHAFKYGGMRQLADPLAHLLYRYLTARADIPWRRADFIAPVPIHPTRQRVRGYNQSELLAEKLSGMTGLPPLIGGVVRNRRTRPQVELSGDQRRDNVRSAFSVPDQALVKGKNILLVDDVATTCSTIHECSLSLVTAGALNVYVVCVAFGA